MYDLKRKSRINEKAVKTIDNLFNENNKDLFEDIPTPTHTSIPTPTPIINKTNKDEIKSVFTPKILIGKKNNGFGNTEPQK